MIQSLKHTIFLHLTNSISSDETKYIGLLRRSRTKEIPMCLKRENKKTRSHEQDLTFQVIKCTITW